MPTAITTRPQFASSPAIAVLTNGELAIASATRFALSSWFTGTVQLVDRATRKTTAVIHGLKAPYDAIPLEDGSVVEVKGNEQIEYDGELHTAANLFDALKEGYYGKF